MGKWDAGPQRRVQRAYHSRQKRKLIFLDVSAWFCPSGAEESVMSYVAIVKEVREK